MIKFIIISHFVYLFSLLNIKCDGRKVSIEVKIIDDWDEKREFIYLKNVEVKERFVLKKIVKSNNRFGCSYNYNIEGFLRRIDVNQEKNNFNVEMDDRCEYSEELRRRILINIANNKIFQSILIGFEKQLLRRNQFNKTKNNYYETSILDETLDHIKKLLSSYWTEINLIGYKIELLEKQKVEYPKELKSKIIDIGNKISGIIEVNKRKCFNCNVTQSKHWFNLLKGHYLCKKCGNYNTNMESLDQKNYGLKLQRTIVNVLFAVSHKQNGGAVIQNLETIYVMHVAVNKEKKLQKRENQTFNLKGKINRNLMENIQLAR
uniref:GATA-type domain-containing protein n=1 Tax=Meloidogyne enterolobii TaxID=390850 RepID=A0A6V7WG74_MELEN|nr:unnamed protein product [Meloidogyne enterolobii]